MTRCDIEGRGNEPILCLLFNVAVQIDNKFCVENMHILTNTVKFRITAIRKHIFGAYTQGEGNLC